MYRIASFLLTLAALGFSFAACEQDPNSSNDSSNFMDQPMKPPPAMTTANPAIVYTAGSSGTVYVMDSSGANQTVVYTGAAAISTPNWSPGNSIVFVESGAIKTAEISVNSSGVPVSSNLQTIASLSSTTHTLTKAVWSSTTSKNSIAFSIRAKTNSGADNYLCVMSASGTTWDTIYTTPYTHNIGGLTWSPDDAKLALMIGSPDGNYFLILNMSTGAVTDSIPVSLAISWTNFTNCVEWSRSSSTINKLAFISHEMVGPRICYLTPTSGSTPTTNNVSLPIFGTLTWSPNNSSLMYVHSEWANKCRCDVYSLTKNRAQTTTTSTVDNSFSAYSMNWHR